MLTGLANDFFGHTLQVPVDSLPKSSGHMCLCRSLTLHTVAEHPVSSRECLFPSLRLLIVVHEYIARLSTVQQGVQKKTDRSVS